MSRWHCHWCDKMFTKGSSCKCHEESQHAPQTEWVCLRQSLFHKDQCVLCKGPFAEGHEKECRFRPLLCLNKEEHERSFDRKDNFIKQHLFGTHRLGPDDGLPLGFQDWERPTHAESVSPLYDCMICDETRMKWAERYDHLCEHYRAQPIDLRAKKSCGCIYGFSSLLREVLERIGEDPQLLNEPCRFACIFLDRGSPRHTSYMPTETIRDAPAWLLQKLYFDRNLRATLESTQRKRIKIYLWVSV